MGDHMGRTLKSNFNRLLARKMESEDKAISLSDVSKETGITLKTLENTWSNKRVGGIDQIHKPTADKLCQYFNCDIGDLVSFNDNNN